ncbi:MAG: 5'-3' exonuclease [Thermoleophilia bacterium]|nr:5'-3' exonuclease [Thermoleophilia bacterium]
MPTGRRAGQGPPLLVADGDSLAHRAFHGLPRTIRDGRGRPANTLVGFATMLAALWRAERPRTVLVAFDTLTAPTYRNGLFPGYQAGREFPPELTEQLDRLPELVGALGFPHARAAGYEADDFLAAAARAETARGGRTLVVTSDRDAFQLASAAVTILMPRRGVSELERVGPAEVRGRYGVEPAQVPDLIALRGDPSDRLPGARGVGAVRAAGILREHGSLEAALAAGRFTAEAGALRTYLAIARLRDDAPLPPLPDTEPDWPGAAALAERWGLRRLAERFRAAA